jgi:hypothetical protein
MGSPDWALSSFGSSDEGIAGDGFFIPLHLLHQSFMLDYCFLGMCFLPAFPI